VAIIGAIPQVGFIRGDVEESAVKGGGK